MEKQVFRKPAVAGVLKKNFVEARLHMDNPDKPVLARSVKVRTRFGVGVATPTFVVVDPGTGKVVIKHEGWIPDEKEFLRFLGGK